MNSWRGVPGLRRWWRDKKQGLGILMVMSLGCFLLAFTFLFSDSLEATMEARRKDAYGEWQYACVNIDASEEAKLGAIPFIERRGCLWSAGILSGQSTYYGVGGMDAEAAELARIHVKEGHLPEQKGEIALEASLVKVLGLSGQLGEPVSFSIDPAEGNAQKILGAESRTIEGTLCGIMEDYANNWYISSKTLIPGILLTEDSIPDFTWPEVRNLLITGVSEWSLDAMESDLRGLEPDPDSMNSESMAAGDTNAKDESTESVADGDANSKDTKSKKTKPEETSGASSGGTWLLESQKYIRNKFLYPDETSDNVQESMQVIRIVTLVLIALISIAVVGSSVKYRKEEWKQLVRLGAEISRLRGLLLQEAIAFLVLSISLGLGSVILVFRLLRPLFSYGLGFSLISRLDLRHLATAAGMSAGVSLIAYLIPLLRMRALAGVEYRSTDSAGPFSGTRSRGLCAMRRQLRIRLRQGIRRKGRSVGTVSFETIFFRQWVNHPLQKLLQFLLLTAMIAIPCIGIRAVSETASLLRGQLKNYGDSYTWEYSYGTEGLDGLPGGIHPNRLDGLDRIYGVASYSAYRVLSRTDLIQADFSAWGGSEYLDEQKDTVRYLLVSEDEACANRERQASDPDTEKAVQERKAWLEAVRNGLDQNILPVSVVAVDSMDTLQPYLQSLEEGQVAADAFARGEEIILFLPDVFEMVYDGDKGFEVAYTERQAQRRIESGNRLLDKPSIRTGDSLSLTWKNETKTVNIGGIIKRIREADAADVYNQNAECMILCSEALLNELLPESADVYQYLRVDADLEAGYGTDTQIARFLYGVNGMEYVNHRQQIEEYRRELSMQVIMYLTLCGAGMCLLAAIQSGISRLTAQYQREQMNIFRDLGMRASWRTALTYLDQAALSLLSVLAVTMFFSIRDMIETNQKLAEWEMAERVGFKIRVGFDLRIFAGICLAVVAVNLLLTGLRMRNRRNPIRKKKSPKEY